MGVVYKQSSRTTLSSFLGAAIGYANVLWLFPAVLSADQIGLIRILPGIAFLLQPLSQLGLAQSVIKFSPRFNKEPGGNKELLTFILIANAFGFGITLVLVKIFQGPIIDFFKAKSALVNDYFYVAVILLLILTYNSLLESFSKSILKIVFPGVIKDIIIRLMYSLFISLLFFELISFSQFVNGLIVIYLTGFLLLLSYLIRKGIFKLTSQFKSFNRQTIREIIGYSLFTVIGASGNYMILHIDQIMLGNLAGLGSNGIYTTAFYIAVITELPRRAIGQISLPLISRSFEEKDLQAVNKLYKQVSINQMIVGSLLLIGILVNIANVFALIPNNEVYITGIDVVLIIGIAKLIDMSFSVNNEIILMSNHYKYNVIFSSLLGMIAVALNWYFIQVYGINGAAIATALALLFFNLAKLLFIKFKLNLWPFRWSNLTVLIIGLATYSIVNLVPFFINIWADILLRSVLVTTLFMTPCFLLKISPEINRVVKQITGMPFF